MQLTDLRTLYLAELQEAQAFEVQIAEALPALADKATDARLRHTIDDDISETRDHADELARMLEAHGVETGTHTDQAMQAILSEAEKWAGTIDDPAVRDAALIASAQRVQHYEIAVYGALAAWAERLRLDDAQTLQAIAEEEKTADIRLTRLAERHVNTQAAA